MMPKNKISPAELPAEFPPAGGSPPQEAEALPVNQAANFINHTVNIVGEFAKTNIFYIIVVVNKVFSCLECAFRLLLKINSESKISQKLHHMIMS